MCQLAFSEGEHQRGAKKTGFETRTNFLYKHLQETLSLQLLSASKFAGNEKVIGWLVVSLITSQQL